MTRAQHGRTDADPRTTDISTAWQEFARLGLPGRYGGRSPEGLFEFLIIDPTSGAALTSGRDETLAGAMRAAARAGQGAHPEP